MCIWYSVPTAKSKPDRRKCTRKEDIWARANEILLWISGMEDEQVTKCTTRTATLKWYAPSLSNNEFLCAPYFRI
jgi:hypothetical protein